MLTTYRPECGYVNQKCSSRPEADTKDLNTVDARVRVERRQSVVLEVAIVVRKGCNTDSSKYYKHSSTDYVLI